MDTGLSQPLLSQIKGVFSKFPTISKAVLFGSRARGDFKPQSDIDIAIFGKTITSDNINQIFMDLSNLPIIYKIDLVHYDSIQDQKFKDIIQRDQKVIYSPWHKI